jgi:hypothetical protein
MLGWQKPRLNKIWIVVAACLLACSAQAAWQITETVDPLTGKPIIRISTLSKSPVTQFNRPLRPNLIVECETISDPKYAREDQLKARLQFPDRVAVLEVTVQYKFDSGASTAFTAKVSDKGDAIFLSLAENDDFMRQLRNARRLRMEVGLRAGPVVVEFDTADAAAAIAKVSCGKAGPNSRAPLKESSAR